MKRHVLSAALLGLAVATPATVAFAGPDIPRPPSILSPNLNDPWLVQLQPGQRGLFAPRANRTTLFGQPQVRQQQPTLIRIPGPATAQPPGAGNRGKPVAPQFLPQIVMYQTKEKAGTIVIDTNERFLYLVLDGGQALRYGVGVGRPGFEWAGVHKVTRKAEWPDWRPPEEMLQRRPELPRFMEGGPNNPLGARALYLGSTLYRIHGSNEPWTIGQAVSSGCIRMRNEDVTDLYERVGVGTKVIVI